MKKIKLANNRGFAIIDDDDFEWVSKFKWQLDTQGYAKRGTTICGNIPLHREVIKAGVGQLVDHINFDKLDNRKCNLRICTHTQNLSHKPPTKRNTSGYKGVSYHKREKRWRATISANRIKYHLGDFLTAIEAAKAYNEVAVKYHGEFAWLNPLKS